MKTTTDELLTLIAIADSGSLTAAAQRLQQTTSAVSRTLTRLERKLETALFARTTRRIQLTEEGQFFLDRARQIVAAVEKAEDDLGSQREQPSGPLRVDSASPFVIHAITPHVSEFNTLYPNIKLELYSNERIIDLLERNVDVAIRIGKLQDSTLHARSLGSSKIRILASPKYLKKFGTPKAVEELQAHRLLGFTAPRELNHWPLKTKLGNSYPIEPHVQASSGETLLHLVRSGAGIACLSDFMTAGDRSQGTLVQILPSQTIDFKQPIQAVYYKNTHVSRRINLFIEFLQKKLKSLQ